MRPAGVSTARAPGRGRPGLVTELRPWLCPESCVGEAAPLGMRRPEGLASHIWFFPWEMGARQERQRCTQEGGALEEGKQ